MYADCYLELLMIQLGKISSSSAAGMNFAQTIWITLYQTYGESEGYLKELNDLAASYTDSSNDEELGWYCGKVFSENLQWVVPTFKVDEFGASE